MVGPAAGGAYNHILQSVSPTWEWLRVFIVVGVAADFAARVRVVVQVIPCNGLVGGHAVALSFEFGECPPFDKHGFELDQVLFLFMGGLNPNASFGIGVEPPVKDAANNQVMVIYGSNVVTFG